MKGKKSCPTCYRQVGPRKRTCECGYEFALARETYTEKSQYADSGLTKSDVKDFAQGIIEDTQKEFPGYTGQKYIVTTPDGPCPVKYNGDIPEWVDSLLAYAEKARVYYSRQAIEYYGRKVFRELPNVLNELDEYLEKLYQPNFSA